MRLEQLLNCPTCRLSSDGQSVRLVSEGSSVRIRQAALFELQFGPFWALCDPIIPRGAAAQSPRSPREHMRFEPFGVFLHPLQPRLQRFGLERYIPVGVIGFEPEGHQGCLRNAFMAVGS